MKRTGTQRKSRLLRVELVILACLACFWIVKSATVDFAGVGARPMEQCDTSHRVEFEKNGKRVIGVFHPPRTEANYTSREQQAQAPIETLTKRKQKTKLSQLNSQFDRDKARIEEDLQHQLKALNNQYIIQRNFLHEKFKTAKTPKEQQQITNRMEQIKVTFIGRAQAAKDNKVHALTELQRAFEDAKEIHQ